MPSMPHGTAAPHRRTVVGMRVMAMESFVESCADINHGYSFTDWSTFYRLRNDAIDELELRRASAPPQHDGKCLRCGKWRITRDLRDHKCECVEKNLREQIDRL